MHVFQAILLCLTVWYGLLEGSTVCGAAEGFLGTRTIANSVLRVFHDIFYSIKCPLAEVDKLCNLS